jgi:hypothetical protein
VSAQIKNSFSSIGELDASIAPAALSLKLSVTDDSLRYFVLSQTHQHVIFFGDYTLHHVTTTSDLANVIEKIFEKDEILQLPFGRVLIGFDAKYSLIPRELSNLLLKDGQLASQCSDTDIVYESPKEIVQVLKKLFTKVELFHLNSTYFKTLPSNISDTTNSFFVNVGKKYFDAIYFRNKEKLQLMNRYDYRTATDFIYFILLCCDELNIDRETTELVLIGEVDIQSKIYDICYRYFRSIRFIQKPEGLYFIKAFELYPKHLHFSLYNLCS